MNPVHVPAITFTHPRQRIALYEDGSILIAVPPELREDFTKLIQRGSNLAPDLSPAMKELSDIITNGKVMQDYYAQTNTPRPQGDHG